MKSSWIIQGCPKPKDNLDNTIISDLQLLWLWENKCLLFYTTKCVLVTAATWKEYTELDRNSFVLVSSGCYSKRPQTVASTTDMASWRSRNQQIWLLVTSSLGVQITAFLLYNGRQRNIEEASCLASLLTRAGTPWWGSQPYDLI